MKNANTAHVIKIDYPWFKGIDITGMTLGASDNGYTHAVFTLHEGILSEAGIDWKQLTGHNDGLFHQNMGGFYVGPLGSGHGNGLALWQADWTDGAHYEPHPFDAYFFAWDGHAFVLEEHLKSTEKYESNDAKPDFLGLPPESEIPQIQYPYSLYSMVRALQ